MSVSLDLTCMLTYRLLTRGHRLCKWALALVSLATMPAPCYDENSASNPDTERKKISHDKNGYHLLNAYCIHDTLYIPIMLKNHHPCFMKKLTLTQPGSSRAGSQTQD